MIGKTAYRLQTIAAGGVVRNHTLTGRALRRLLQNEPVYGLIPNTWLEGGCRILAEALKAWGGEAVTLKAVYSYRFGAQRIDHVAAVVDNICLDGDGAATEMELLAKARLLEDLVNPVLMPFDAAEADAAGIPSDPRATAELVRFLQRRFGGFDTFRKNLREERADQISRQEVNPFRVRMERAYAS